MNAPESITALREFMNHDLVDDIAKPGVRVEKLSLIHISEPTRPS